MEIIKREKDSAVIIKDGNRDAKLILNIKTGEVIDFEENWTKPEIKEARRLLNLT